MLRVLIRKELLHHLRSFRFAAAGITCFTAVLGAVTLSGLAYQAALSERSALVFQHHEEVLSYNAWSRLLWEGVRIDKPMNPMTLFVRDPDRGHLTVASVNAYWEPAFVDAGLGNLVARLLTSVDLEFLVTAMLSLMAIAFSYDAVSGEREQGTLRLTLSYPISKGLLLGAKGIGGFLALCAPYLASVACGALIISLGFDLRLDAAAWAGLVALVATSLLYLLAIFCLGVCVSALAERSTTAIVLLLLVWSTAVLVVPSLSPHLAARLAPTAEPGEIERQKQQRHRDIEARWRPERDRWSQDDFASGFLYWAHRNGLRRDQFLEQMDTDEAINERFRRELTRQVRLGTNLARISPAASFRFIAASLSATGAADSERFWQALVDYRAALCRYGFDRWAQMARRNHERTAAGLRWQDTYDVEDYPRFAYQHVGPGQRLAEAVPDVVLLCLWCALFWAVGYAAFARCDVT